MVDKLAPRTIRAIEDSFPVVEINRLAIHENNPENIRPIYKMHRWFARRASCVFRAILLGCLKSLPLDENGKPTKTGAEVIMEEFYKEHANDQDTKGKSILDPFMGRGTTVVEAMRLGCAALGIDLNPVAWFIVKTEVEPVDCEALKDAFERLARRIVPWSGKPLRETLLDQYRTQCPCCGTGDVDIIYTFWVKSAICTDCGKQVPLFKDYLIAQKNPSIRYFRDVSCPRCHKTFDWEVEPAALVAEPVLQVNSPAYSAGAGRSTARWACSPGKSVTCPWCSHDGTARPSKAKRERKKVPLAVLLCPFCQTVWQWRGELPELVNCPVCSKEYNPLIANVPAKGEFQCSCGHRDDTIRSIRRLREDQLLPIHPYAIEGYCAGCAGESLESEVAENGENGHLFATSTSAATPTKVPDHDCRISKNAGKFFKQVTPADLHRIEEATATWEREKNGLPYPKQAIPTDGQETHRLLEHHYRYWHQMFHPRQLLSLATLLDGVKAESDATARDLLLCALSGALEANNLFTRYISKRSTPGGTPPAGVFARHDYQPKSTICEQNVFGSAGGNNTFVRRQGAIIEGVDFAARPYNVRRSAREGKFEKVTSAERCWADENDLMISADSREALRRHEHLFDLVVTDPPYASNVNYAELADFFYVWLRLVLAHERPEFAPNETPKLPEIIVNPTRGKSTEDFARDLQQVFSASSRVMKDDGVFAFTFHHSEGSAWEAVLHAVCESGFVIEAVYPVAAEREESLHLLETESISYDLIHVCKKRNVKEAPRERPWASIRQEIRRRARTEIAAIEAGRYGSEPLSPNDVNIILIGKCLELYSRHYGAVIDHEGKKVPLHQALKQIRDIADQMVEREHPLPSELEDIDPESRIYLRALCRVKEVKSDEVHKATRGVLEPADLIETGLITKMRAGRGRSYEVKQPGERLTKLLERFGGMAPSTQESLFSDSLPSRYAGTLFVDRVHLLLGLVEAGENLLPWLDRFRAETPQIRAAMEYIEGHSKHLAAGCRRVLSLLEVGPLLKGAT
jgi:16S rRNA G966 N2-methylase RsmD